MCKCKWQAFMLLLKELFAHDDLRLNQLLSGETNMIFITLCRAFDWQRLCESEKNADDADDNMTTYENGTKTIEGIKTWHNNKC